MFRTVIYFNAALRNQDCKVLASDLEHIKFEKGGAREEKLTYKQAINFIRTALEFGEKGLMPADRCLHLAIGTAAQFELMLRQMDIIGEWAKATASRKLPVSITTLGAWPGQMGGLLHLRQHTGLALAHEDVQVEVPLGRGFRPHEVRPPAAAA
jgi:hypothetical protein